MQFLSARIGLDRNGAVFIAAPTMFWLYPVSDKVGGFMIAVRLLAVGLILPLSTVAITLGQQPVVRPVSTQPSLIESPETPNFIASPNSAMSVPGTPTPAAPKVGMPTPAVPVPAVPPLAVPTPAGPAKQTASTSHIMLARTPPIVPATALSLSDIEQMALANHPAIAEAWARVEAAQGNQWQVGLWPNPFVGYSGQQLGSRGQAEQNGVLFGQEIVRGGKLRLNRAVADKEVLKAEQFLSIQEARVLTDVRVAFYDTLIAQRRMEVNQELTRIGEQVLQTAEALLKAREASRVDVLQAKLETEQARIQLANSTNRHAAAWRELTAVANDPHLQPQPLAGNVEAMETKYDWETSLNRLLGSSPEIALIVAEIERARCAIARACAEPIPNLSIQAVIQRDAQIDSTDGAIQATMPIPVFNRNQGAIREAQANLAAAEQSLQRKELELRNRLAVVFERYANARNQVDKYRKDILPSAKESLDLTREGYRAGEFGFLNLLTSQRTYFQTSLSYLDSLRELWAASMEIDGMLLKGALGSAE